MRWKVADLRRRKERRVTESEVKRWNGIWIWAGS